MTVSNYKQADIIKEITNTALSALEGKVTGEHVSLRYRPLSVTVESRHRDWTATRRSRKRIKNADIAENSKQPVKNANDLVLIKYIYLIMQVYFNLFFTSRFK